MRVLSVIHYPVFGGPHNRNLRIIPHLRSRGCETVVLLPDDPGNAARYLMQNGIEVAQLKLSRIRSSTNPADHLKYLFEFSNDINRIRRVINELNIDIVQINGLVNAQAAIAARREGIRVVWQILDTFPPMMLRRIMMPIVRRYADVLMVTGKKVADEHPGAKAFDGRLIFFYPPVDLTLFQKNSERRAAGRKELGISPEEHVIGTVGNINRQKGHRTFIRAAAKLRRLIPNTRFVILGASHQNHARLHESLWNEAKSLGLSVGNDLLVLDPKGRVYELEPAFDIFWMTSEPNSEGVPTAIEEGMALGLPVVSTEVGSISEIVEDGRTGFVVPPFAYETMATKTMQILKDKKTYNAFSGNAEDSAAKFSVDACVQKHLDAFRMALNRA